jgi:hypothetical protein
MLYYILALAFCLILISYLIYTNRQYCYAIVYYKMYLSSINSYLITIYDLVLKTHLSKEDKRQLHYFIKFIKASLHMNFPVEIKDFYTSDMKKLNITLITFIEHYLEKKDKSDG